MSDVSILNVWEKCQVLATKLDLKIVVIGTNILVQNNEQTAIFYDSTVDGVYGFLCGVNYANIRTN